MARKRLSGPLPDYLDPDPVLRLSGVPPGSHGLSPRAPIAQIATEAATLAAFDAVATALRTAREGGRMVLSLPLDTVVLDHLIRDRIDTDTEAMTALKASLRARGQQTPIEVAEIPGGRYGLISGWRRCLALAALQAETGEARFASVLALVRRPGSGTGSGGGSDAYVAMVEENEIRAGLSFYERARIVIRAVEAGIYPSEKAALQGLFSTASYAKRSKVKSFVPVVAALDGVLRFPARIPERTGLALAQALGAGPGFAVRAATALQAAAPATPEAEAAVLARLLRPDVGPDVGPSGVQSPGGSLSGVHLSGGPGRVVLEGAGVDQAFLDRLRHWLDGSE